MAEHSGCLKLLCIISSDHSDCFNVMLGPKFPFLSTHRIIQSKTWDSSTPITQGRILLQWGGVALSWVLDTLIQRPHAGPGRH